MSRLHGPGKPIQPGPRVQIPGRWASVFSLESGAETKDLGARLARLLRAGDLLILSGPLGAGKTTFTQGVCAGLGVTDPVTSPTFVLARAYRGGRLPVVHVDAYRLSSIEEIDDLDLDLELDTAVTLVEWGHGLADHLKDSVLVVHLDRAVDGPEDLRTARFEPRGGDWAERLASDRG